jgi:hypothetical protein
MSTVTRPYMQQPDILVVPGEHLENDPRLMRDYLCLSYDTDNDMLGVTVGDMANNHTGTDYIDRETATYLGLDQNTRFNGGLIGSAALKQGLEGVDTSGTSFVETANGVLRETHTRLGVMSKDGAERFTGYLAHAVITPDIVRLTTVGDVNTWINGNQLVDSDHPLGDVVNSLLADFTHKPGDWEQTVADFAGHVDLDIDTADSLLLSLRRQYALTDTFTRQDAYLATSRVLTPWYMNRLQNTTDHPYSYGAIDGTRTPDAFIHEAAIPTADIDTLVIATDGSRPHEASAGVFSLGDLVASNPVYCERTAIDLSGPVKQLARLA